MQLSECFIPTSGKGTTKAAGMLIVEFRDWVL